MGTPKVRLCATIVVEYDADPDHYGTDDAAIMAKDDQENWSIGPRSMFDLTKNRYRTLTVTVKPVAS